MRARTDYIAIWMCMREIWDWAMEEERRHSYKPCSANDERLGISVQGQPKFCY